MTHPQRPRMEPTIYERSAPGRRGAVFGESDVSPAQVPQWAARKSAPLLPEVTAPDVVRHFTRLSRLNFSVDTHFYPLGSCTMKYNPRANERLSSREGFSAAHPYQNEDDIQGLLQILWELERYLCEIAGLSRATLSPAAGAHGELAGMMMIAAWHRERKTGRNVVLLPDSAHGTNPASAAVCGFTPRVMKSGADGEIDLDVLREAARDDVAAIMLTNPNTLGIFESRVSEITQIVHDAGGLVYMDGANMNAIIGFARPGDFGVDVMHFNPHKTFSTPHGCGGPGAGPVAVGDRLVEYLPGPLVEKEGERFVVKAGGAKSIGRMKAFFGNVAVLVKAYLYIRSMGAEGMRLASEVAVLNANYMRARLSKVLPLAYETQTLHEFVLSGKELSKYGVRVFDVAKRLLDYGYHPPTVYFPLLVAEAMMIEPTETENLETLDDFVEALTAIVAEARENPGLVTGAPHTTPVGRLDEAKAVKEPRLTWSDDGGDG